VLSGARILEGFVQDGDRWSIGQQTQQGEVAGSCELPAALEDVGEYTGCRYPEQLFFDSEPLWQVTALEDLAPGRWYFDYDADRIVVQDDPSGRVVEASTTTAAFVGTAADVEIRGLVIEKYSTPTQTGAIQAPRGLRWLIEDNEIRLNHSYGLRVGPQMVARNNNIHHNGQLGIGGIGDQSVFEGNEIAYNNAVGGFHEEWEAGGVKVVRSTGVRFEGNWVHHNTGRGLWSDIDMVDLLIEDNLVEWNSRGGIVHEIGYAAEIVDNVARYNGLGFDVWLWGAQILVQNSSDVMVHGNVVTVSTEGGNGITIVNQDRGSGDRGAYVSNRVTITENTIRHEGRRGLNGSHDCQQGLDNVYVGNTYEAPAAWFNGQPFMWCDFLTWAEFRNTAGQEAAGVAVELS